MKVNANESFFSSKRSFASDPSLTLKDRRNVALYSFLLPGLGQVYLGFWGRGISLFLGFTLLALIPEARLLLPLAAFLAAAEAYRLKHARTMPLALPAWLPAHEVFEKLFRPTISRSKARDWAFTMAAVIAFCGWFLLFVPILYPFRVQVELNDRIELLSDRVRAYRALKGKLPSDLSEALNAEDNAKTLLSDPWGRPFRLEATESGFVIRSFGSDGKPETGDDYLYHFR